MKNKLHSAIKFCIYLKIIKLSCWETENFALCIVGILVSSTCNESLRLKKNEYIELENENWLQLKELGLSPGFSLYLEGVKITKQKG